MTTVVMPKLELDALIPTFELPTVDGNIIRLWDYKQKENLVIFLVHGLDCEPCMARISEAGRRYDEFQEREAQVLVIVEQKPEGNLLDCAKGLPFPILIDEDGKVTRNFTEVDENGCALPSVFVVDRFNALNSAYIAEKEPDLPSVDEILATLSLAEMQCPECGI